MTKFLYQVDRNEEEESIEILSYYYDQKGEISVEKTRLPYQLFMRKEDFDKIEIQSDKIEISDKKYRDIEGRDVVELLIKDKELSEYIFKKTRDVSFPLFESDLKDEHRFLIEQDLEIQKGEFVEPKVLSIDIETIGDPNNQEIILISSYSESGIAKVYLNKASTNKNQLKNVGKQDFKEFKLEVLEDEKELLTKFREDILDFSPQLIVGWNVIDFDFKVIKEKMDFHNIPFSFSSFEGDTKLRIINDFFRRSTLTGPGLIVFDIIDILRTNFIEFEDYKLNTVAQEVLGDEKISLQNDENADISIEEKIKTIQTMFEKDLKTLIEYNFKDSFLTLEICKKLDLIKLMCERSVITGTPLSKVRSPIASLDIMYLKELHKRGYVAPSNFNFQDTSPIEGAYVMSPERGFYDDVYVLDFKSLYPSIITTFNLDPFTYKSKGDIQAPNGAKFVREPGILPELIRGLAKERERAKKENNKVKSHAIKITMNSFYGSIASPKCRFYNKDIGEAITSFGRTIIQTAKKHMEEQGYKVLYGDTDSIFISSKHSYSSVEEKKREGKTIEKELNSFFEEWVKENYNVENHLQIEFEKLFSKFFIASKKRYVGYDEFIKKTVFVGMEAIRGDWTDLAKRFQRELIDLIFKETTKEELITYIKNFVSKIKTGEYNDELIYKKKITKPLHMYTKTTPPHVRAARELETFEGRLVKYIMTNKGPKHVTFIDENTVYDYDHYVEKQLKGVSDDLLEMLDIDFDEVIESRTQKSLNKFF